MHQWFPDRVRARARSRSGARPVASNLLRRAMASLIGSVKLLISSAKPAIGGARRRDGEIRMGHGLWVHCDNRECLHRAHIDLEAIAEHYGEELSVAEFVNRSVCSECGARWPDISISLEPVRMRDAKMGYSARIEKKPQLKDPTAERKARRRGRG